MMYNNPYYNYVQPQIPRMDPMQQTYRPQAPVMGLQGKTVDSLDVVKAMDIPLDGSISYFPLIDGTAIVTKQLQQDGTSKTVIYKPIENNQPTINYVTEDQMKEAINSINIKDYSKDIEAIKTDVKGLKRRFKNLSEDTDDKEE